MPEQPQQYVNQLMEQRIQSEEEGFDACLFDECFADKILEQKYQKVTTREVADLQDHLTQEQRDQLNRVLEKHTSLFDKELGCYPDRKFHLKLIEDYKPVFKKAYLVPYKNEHLFKKELDSLIKDGVLEKCGPSTWAL